MVGGREGTSTSRLPPFAMIVSVLKKWHVRGRKRVARGWGENRERALNIDLDVCLVWRRLMWPRS